MSQFQNKTIKFIGKSQNPAAAEVLFTLLDNSDAQFRNLAFSALYMKRENEIYVRLFKYFLKDEEFWSKTEFLTGERLARIADAAFRDAGGTYRETVAEVTKKYKLYEMLPTTILFLESSDAQISALMRSAVLQLAESFYADILAAPESERRNFDRKREWFVQQLDTAVKRYAVHHFDEVLKSLLIISKKEYDTMKAIAADHRSAAAQKVSENLLSGEHGSYIRLLLSYLNDLESPATMDQIIKERSDALFVRKMLEYIGTNPSIDFREALKRFTEFKWFTTENPHLPELVEGLEPCAVQLLQSASLPKDRTIRLYRFFLERHSPESRRAAAESVRRLLGDDVNRMLLEFVNNSDPQTASIIFKILQSRNTAGLEAILPKLIERPEPAIRQAVYDGMPDLHVEALASRITHMTPYEAEMQGYYVRLVDPNTYKIIGNDIVSPIPIRRMAACRVASVTGYAKEFAPQIIRIAEEDSERQVRYAAITVLENVLTKEALETLKRLMVDRATDIRDAAEQAVKNWAEKYRAKNGVKQE
ncbi:MAG: hypothetical protein LBT46_10850 [Planctomycetaceae bacterium]|jgi:hypothetical protein|nr:hypothetical protein [Planctomycetaceae bacterium]